MDYCESCYPVRTVSKGQAWVRRVCSRSETHILQNLSHLVCRTMGARDLTACVSVLCGSPSLPLNSIYCIEHSTYLAQIRPCNLDTADVNLEQLSGMATMLLNHKGNPRRLQLRHGAAGRHSPHLTQPYHPQHIQTTEASPGSRSRQHGFMH